MSEAVVPFESLALVRNHVALELYHVFLSLLPCNDCYVLWDLVAQGVFESVLILELCALANLIWRHQHLLVSRRENVAHSFQAKGRCNHVNFVHVWVVELLHSVLVADLRRVVNSFYIDADSLRVVWVCREIAIEIAESLLVVTCSLPEANKLCKFFVVHERHVIYMPVNLSTEHDRGWSALATDSFWIWLVACFAIVIDLVALLHGKRLKLELVLLLQLSHEVVKALVLELPHCILRAVYALLRRPAAALWLVLLKQLLALLLLLHFLLLQLLLLCFLLLFPLFCLFFILFLLYCLLLGLLLC